MAEIFLDTSTLRQSDFMTPAYIAKYGSEPSIAQRVERQNIAQTQRQLEAEIKAAFPNWQTKPVTMRMKKTGVVLHTSFDNVFAAMARGDAELVKP